MQEKQKIKEIILRVAFCVNKEFEIPKSLTLSNENLISLLPMLSPCFCSMLCIVLFWEGGSTGSSSNKSPWMTEVANTALLCKRISLLVFNLSSELEKKSLHTRYSG